MELVCSYISSPVIINESDGVNNNTTNFIMFTLRFGCDTKLGGEKRELFLLLKFPLIKI